MASKLKLFTCKDTRIDCRNRTEEGRCRILCNTDFKDNDCSFYKSKQGGKKNEV